MQFSPMAKKMDLFCLFWNASRAWSTHELPCFLMLANVFVAQDLATMMVGPEGQLVPFAFWFDLAALGRMERWSRHEVLHDVQEPHYLLVYLNAHVTGSNIFAFIGFAPPGLLYANKICRAIVMFHLQLPPHFLESDSDESDESD